MEYHLTIGIFGKSNNWPLLIFTRIFGLATMSNSNVLVFIITYSYFIKLICFSYGLYLAFSVASMFYFIFQDQKLVVFVLTAFAIVVGISALYCISCYAMIKNNLLSSSIHFPVFLLKNNLLKNC